MFLFSVTASHFGYFKATIDCLSFWLYPPCGTMPIVSGAKKLRRKTKLHAEAIVKLCRKGSTPVSVISSCRNFMEHFASKSTSEVQKANSSPCKLNVFPLATCSACHFKKSSRCSVFIVLARNIWRLARHRCTSSLPPCSTGGGNAPSSFQSHQTLWA